MSITYEDLTATAKHSLEPIIAEALAETLKLMTRGEDVYGAADIAASRWEIEVCHGEILARLKNLLGTSDKS